jgi:hypothetical protein
MSPYGSIVGTVATITTSPLAAISAGSRSGSAALGRR